MYIKDASGKTYEHFGGPRDPVASDPHESSQFFHGTSAIWKDLDTSRRGVLFDPATREIIKLSSPNADQIKDYLKEMERKLWLFNYEVVPIGSHASHGFKDMLVTFIKYEQQHNTNALATPAYHHFRRQMNFINTPFVGLQSALYAACMSLGSYTGPGSVGIWNQINSPFALPTGTALDQLSEMIAGDYDVWEKKLKRVHDMLAQIAPVANQLASYIVNCSGNMIASPWSGGSVAQHELAMQSFGNRIQGMAGDILAFPPPPSVSFNAVVSDQRPLDWVDDSMLEHRTFEFVPFNTGAADIPFLQGAPMSMITRVLERAKQELKSSAVSAAVLEQNLQSLLDCTDPLTQHGFDPSPYPKTVVIEDLVKYIETMYSGTRNKRRFEASERLHVFGVDAGMNVLDYGNYENLWFKHVDPTGLRSAARRAMLSATTEDELVAAIIQSTTASILCSLRMHLIHFSAALRPNEFAKITSMLQNKNSTAYKNFKSVLGETMGDVFEVKGHPLEHFEAKIMNFESSEAWFSSMLSLVYSACPLTIDNPQGLKRSSCSVKVLEDSYMYFHEEEPLLQIFAEVASAAMRDSLGLGFSPEDQPRHAVVFDEAWKSVTKKGFRFSNKRTGTSVFVQKGKIESNSSASEGGFNFSWDNNGNSVIEAFDPSDSTIKTFPVFASDGRIHPDFFWSIRAIILPYNPDAEFVLDDVYSMNDGNTETGFYVSQDANGAPKAVHYPTKMSMKSSTGTLANITTINFGNSAASGSPSQVYDDQIIGDAGPNDEPPVIDYAEQAGNLE